MNGPRCEMAFEFHGTKGAVSWNYERMNELDVFLPDGTPAHDGRVLIQAGEAHPAYSAFYPGRANAMGYEDSQSHRVVAVSRIGRPEPTRRAGLRPKSCR